MITTQSEKKLNAVRQFATRMHGAQQYGDRAYTTHLDSVDAIVVEASLHDYMIATYIWTLRAGAYLHDIVEDTVTTLSDLRAFLYELVPPGTESFEPDLIVDLVRAVTDPLGQTRQERKTALVERMSREPYPVNKLALALKLCDRLANVRQCRTSINPGFSDSMLSMYRKEQADFSRLRSPGELEYLWGRLAEALSCTVARDVT